MSFSGIHLNKRGAIVLLCLICLLMFYKFSPERVQNTTGKINLRRLLEVAIKSAKNGGFEVVNVKDDLKIENKGLTKEGALEKVTTADFLSHCSMLNTVTHFYPQLTIISEEAEATCENEQKIDYDLENLIPADLPEKFVDKDDVTIWIDPLDATQEYTENLYEYVTTMVCVAIKGEPVIGVIHRPFEKETSWAWIGYGKSPDLHLQLKPHKVNQRKLKVIISRSHSGQVKNILDNNIKNVQIIEAGGSGYKTLQVAAGKVDAYVHVTAIKKWDICAGNAILRGVGGEMTTKFNTTIDYGFTSLVKNDKGLIASLSSTIHNIFVGKL